MEMLVLTTAYYGASKSHQPPVSLHLLVLVVLRVLLLVLQDKKMVHVAAKMMVVLDRLRKQEAPPQSWPASDADIGSSRQRLWEDFVKDPERWEPHRCGHPRVWQSRGHNAVAGPVPK
jgi:hypothetical protein